MPGPTRCVQRVDQIIYDDLYYIWTYPPPDMYASFYRQSKRFLYRKHICGIGYYSRFHARHIVSLMCGSKALIYIHIIKGDKLIKQGITHLPQHYLHRVYINSPFTKDGSRKLKKWIYPPEYKFDRHRRRAFVLKLVAAAEDKGPKAFNRIYKSIFVNYRDSMAVRSYIGKRREIYYKYLHMYRQKFGLPLHGPEYDRELLHNYKKNRSMKEGSIDIRNSLN